MDFRVKLWPVPGRQIVKGTEADLEGLTSATLPPNANRHALLERILELEARCAELQSHQDDYDQAHAGIEAAERDAARYRWLRNSDNDYGRSLLATCGPEKLDKAIDAAIAKGKA